VPGVGGLALPPAEEGVGAAPPGGRKGRTPPLRWWER